MKNITGAVIVGLGLALAYGVAKVLILSYQSLKPVPQVAQVLPQPRPVQPSSPAVVPERPALEPPAPPAEAAPAAPKQKSKPTPTAGPLIQYPEPQMDFVSPSPEPFVRPQPDTNAREALCYVGMDSDAEEYWYGAINDPNVSAKDRQDLIEDLNEVGFVDPHHPTADELPLVINRLLLIESVADDAMDKVNADAFQEAHKDLVNIYEKLAWEQWDSW